MITITITAGQKLIDAMRRFPKTLEAEMQKAMEKSSLMVEGESKRRTPVLTGLLRSSIGGQGGWHKVLPWSATAGTNVKYAVYVHEGNGRHVVGENKFIDKGLKASVPFIEKSVHEAVSRAAKSI